MSDDVPTTYRFDPHDPGIVLGLSSGRLATLGVTVGGGMLALYAGRVLLAALLIFVIAPVVLMRWEGMSLAAWVARRGLWAVRGPRRWAVDPERVGFSDPLSLNPEKENG
ncbi:MAG: hypothetical protein M0P31_17740 [Solirubrobacteraceae bacterium]|nr:hypothetical protein [Solirubrobacteraceae bacterium]